MGRWFVAKLYKLKGLNLENGPQRCKVGSNGGKPILLKQKGLGPLPAPRAARGSAKGQNTSSGMRLRSAITA